MTSVYTPVDHCSSSDIAQSKNVSSDISAKEKTGIRHRNLVDRLPEPDTEWDSFKTGRNPVASDELGHRKREKNRWISQETETLATEVTEARLKKKC